MAEFKITVINNHTGDVVDEFVGEFEDRDELTRLMKAQIHNYDIHALNCAMNLKNTNNIN